MNYKSNTHRTPIKMGMFKLIFSAMLVLMGAGSAWAQFNFSRFVVTGNAGLAQGQNFSNEKWVPIGEIALQHKIFPNFLFGSLNVGYANLKAPVYWSRTGYAIYEFVLVPASGESFYPFLTAGGGAGKSVYTTGTAYFALTKFGVGTVTRISRDFIMKFGYNYFVGSDKLDGVLRSNTNVNPLVNGRYDALQNFYAGIGLEFGPRRFDGSRSRSDRAAWRELRREKNEDRELLGLEAESGEEFSEAIQIDSLSSPAAVDTSGELEFVTVDQKPVSTASPWRWFSFGFNEHELSAESKAICNEVAAMLTRNPLLTITIAGHTDDVGSAANNQKVSLARAEKVKEYLMSRGIEGERISVVGKGESEPKSDNLSPRGRAENRRIEFWPR